MAKSPQTQITTPEESPLSENEDPEDDVTPPSYTEKHEERTQTQSLFTKIPKMFSHIRLPFPTHNRRIIMGGLTHRKNYS